jgi:hypothetical protein
MRLVMCVFVAIAGLSGSALAQSNTKQSPAGGTSSTAGTPERQSPVGHRQPKAKDLPPDILQNEQRTTTGDKGWDKNLIICKGC